jgi:Fe2+ transport system protein B
MEKKTNIPNREKKNQTPFINLLSSDELDRHIKNLSAPSFLGSVHLKQRAHQNISSVDTPSKSGTDLKVSDSIKNVVFNPITKVLVVAAILFNVFWFLFKLFI